MTDSPRILLIQARTTQDPMGIHELEAFADRCELPVQAFGTFNIAEESLKAFNFDGFDALMVGGSGDFSLVEGGFDWHENFLKLMARIVDAGIPTFASCFGFQGIVQALGGKLARAEERAELGTFSVTLTEAGTKDPLFGDLPREFDAQFGHNDSAITLSDELIHLAQTERCEYQAVRVRGLPIVATQFHPELTRCVILDLFRNYLKNYTRPEHSFDEAMAYAESIHRPSPHSCGLLHSFVNDLRQRRRALALAAE